MLVINIAIIGGTGVYDPSVLTNISKQEVITPYGNVEFKVGEYAGQKVAFIPRHGSSHAIPPHLINYRANIWAMKKIGVRKIVATTAVGSLNPAMKPGDFVLVNQFLDFTKGRVSTFFQGGKCGVVHVDLTDPYCPDLRMKIQKAAQRTNIALHLQGTYVCTEGPRFETPAEIKMFAHLGGDIVGMTNVPEVILAREAEICYATVSMITNFGAGISQNPLTHSEVIETMNANTEKIKKLIMATIEEIADNRDSNCGCQNALNEYGGFKFEE